MVKEYAIDRFGNGILKNSILWYNDGEENLRYFLDKIKPEKILEIGTMFGLSSVVLAEYGEVDTFDIEDYQEKYDVWNYFDVTNKIKFNLREYRNTKKKYDFVLIDGEHWHGYVEKDYNKCKDIENILIHDYNNAHTEIKEFIDKLDRKKEFKNNFCLIN